MKAKKNLFQSTIGSLKRKKLTIFLALLSLFVACLLFYLGKEVKEITFRPIAISSVIELKEPISEIKIYYSNKLINELFVTQIEILNSGNKDIIADDFEEPLQVDFGVAIFLKPKIIERKPKSILFEISKVEGSKILFNKKMFKKNEVIVIKAFTLKKPNISFANNRIRDVEIKDIQYKEKRRVGFIDLKSKDKNGLWFLLVLIPLFLFFGGWDLFKRNSPPKNNVLVLIDEQKEISKSKFNTNNLNFDGSKSVFTNKIRIENTGWDLADIKDNNNLMLSIKSEGEITGYKMVNDSYHTKNKEIQLTPTDPHCIEIDLSSLQHDDILRLEMTILESPELIVVHNTTSSFGITVKYM